VINWDTVGLGLRTDRELAQALGCTPQSVRDARRARGVDRYRPPPTRRVGARLPLDAAEILDQACERLGWSQAQVISWALRHSAPSLKGGQPGPGGD